MQAVERAITHAREFDREALARRLVDDTTTVAEQIARELNLPPVEVMRLLPEDLCRWAPGTAFAEVMGDVSGQSPSRGTDHPNPVSYDAYGEQE